MHKDESDMAVHLEDIQRRKIASVALIGLTVIASIMYSYSLSFTDRGLPLTDWFNIAVNVLWLCVLAWAASSVYREKKEAKGTVLFLACLVTIFTGVDLVEADGTWLLAAISTLEALLLFGAYLLIRGIHTLDNQNL